MGISAKSFGEAGLARCMMASTGPSTITWLLTSWRMKLNARLVMSSAMLASFPVTRLSMQTTSSPRSSKARHRCEPRKPAPPLTTTSHSRPTPW